MAKCLIARSLQFEIAENQTRNRVWFFCDIFNRPSANVSISVYEVASAAYPSDSLNPSSRKRNDIVATHTT